MQVLRLCPRSPKSEIRDVGSSEASGLGLSIQGVGSVMCALT